MDNQNFLVSGKISIVVRRDIWTNFLSKIILRLRVNKNLPWTNCTFLGDVWSQFVLSHQDGVLVVDTSFQEKKKYLQPCNIYKFNIQIAGNNM